MKIIESSVDEIYYWHADPVAHIAKCARVAYQSEESSKRTDSELIQVLIKSGHHSVLEHSGATVIMTVDRGVTHQLVRHRIASYTQESTHYINYSKKGGMRVIYPVAMQNASDTVKECWEQHMIRSEQLYEDLLKLGQLPQTARSILPNALAAQIACTANFREWRTIFEQRCGNENQKDMQHIMVEIRKQMLEDFPEMFTKEK